MKSALTVPLVLFATAVVPAPTRAQDTAAQDTAAQETLAEETLAEETETEDLAGASGQQPEPDERVPFVTGIDSLDPFLWTARPLIVFADTPNDPRFIRQMELLEAQPEDLLTRQVVVITDSDPSQNGALRKKLRPRGFVTVLVGKDGEIKLRKPSPWSVRELSAVIDKMPLRRDEILDAKRSAGEG